MIIKVPLYFEVNVKKKPSEVSMLINGLDESLYALLLETFGDTNCKTLSLKEEHIKVFFKI